MIHICTSALPIPDVEMTLRLVLLEDVKKGARDREIALEG